MKILIIGQARHGKDTFAEILAENFEFSYKSSSEMSNELFIFDELKHKYNYSTLEECFLDRFNHRKEWYDMICQYNTPIKSRLARDIISKYNSYVGMRDNEEFITCYNEKLFDIIIYIDASLRLPSETKSMNIDINSPYIDFIVNNNTTLEDFRNKTIRIGDILGLKKRAFSSFFNI